MPPPKRKKLYVGCAINNLPADQKKPFLKMIKDLKHKLRQDDWDILEFMSALKSNATAEEIYWRDIHECVATADAMVSICDHPSTGLGYEMGVAIEKRGIPVLAMARYGSSVSKLVLGIHGREVKKKFNFVRYAEVVDIPRIIKEQFGIREWIDSRRKNPAHEA